MPSARTKRINKQLGDLYLHGWQITGPHTVASYEGDATMSGPDNPTITMLPRPDASPRGWVSLASWRIADERGEIVFCAWCRGDGFRLACYRGGSLAPADFPQWFVRTDDDWWRVRAGAVRRLMKSVEAAA